MKKRLLAFGFLMFLPGFASADAVVADWVGRWDCSIDGRTVTLDVRDSKGDCTKTPWCNLVIDCTDAQGNHLPARIQIIDDRFQHMSFTINFDNNDQDFEAHIFSWDKSKMAGTTIWHGRTFGFSATKTPTP